MWTRLAQLPLPWRWLVKWLVFGAVVLFALYPHPRLALKQLDHFRHIESLIQPDLPGIAEINRKLDGQLREQGSRRDEFKTVERFVYNLIPYEYDWYNWGNLDYWPTTAEVLARKREDCDGRAVLAASILRARGFKSARIVANLNHVWVAVDDAELMGPQPDKNFRRVGNKTVITLPAWRTWLDCAAHINRFPAARSLLILAALLVLAYHPCRNLTGLLAATSAALVGFVLLVDWANRYSTRGTITSSAQMIVALAVALVAVSFALAANRIFNRMKAAPVNLPVGQAANLAASDVAARRDA